MHSAQLKPFRHADLHGEAVPPKIALPNGDPVVNPAE
jgi:hypothetical protein